jgi:hypothetical protein
MQRCRHRATRSEEKGNTRQTSVTLSDQPSSQNILLNACGVIVHQTYNQLFPAADQSLADSAKHKDNLGYHDIRLSNTPDPRLIDFIGNNLPATLPEQREKFDEYKDLLADFADRAMGYPEFAARVRRRKAGVNEDSDWPDVEPDSDEPDYEPEDE